ncbi:hypothetical protein B0H17DRAFT_1128911 [Mycena rosella]|uniref:Uncharacterized protein n=1 Tax=Mycena rosella TaxID=1033263 RepID=A0AAD7GLG0_MYCRO|nr:hypothetical protein B0H17DRAFT_1128911 [Mycena rosella]
MAETGQSLVGLGQKLEFKCCGQSPIDVAGIEATDETCAALPGAVRPNAASFRVLLGPTVMIASPPPTRSWCETPKASLTECERDLQVIHYSRAELNLIERFTMFHKSKPQDSLRAKLRLRVRQRSTLLAQWQAHEPRTAVREMDVPREDVEGHGRVADGRGKQGGAQPSSYGSGITEVVD